MLNDVKKKEVIENFVSVVYTVAINVKAYL